MTRITALELSASALVRITVAALVSALLALVLFVLPAEFDTDPTASANVGHQGDGGIFRWRTISATRTPCARRPRV